MSFEAALRALAGSGAAGLCTWSMRDGEARILAADDAVAALLGLDRSVLDARIAAGLDWRDLLPDDQRALASEALSELAEHGHDGPRELDLAGDSGERVAVLLVSTVADAGRGEVASLWLDVREQARARHDAERASHAKSRFLAAVTHELRTPLNTIAGQTSLLAGGVHGPVTDTQHNALERIERAERQLRRVVDDVLTYSRLEAGTIAYDVAPVVLCEALADVPPTVATLLAAKSVAFDVRLPDDDCRVLADADKLREIVRALLANAVRFTPPQGRVTLDTATRPEVPSHVFVRVSDTGRGIARARQQAIFEPFTQEDEGLARRSEGIGLGLTIARDLARGMGGELRVRSTEGRGTVFTLALRRA
jgi:signal transduction histidine kinase